MVEARLKTDGKSDFKTRLISALVLAPIVVFLAWLGGFWFSGLMVVVALLMYREWTTITLGAMDIKRDAFAILIILLLILTTVLYQSAAPVLFCIILIVAGALLLQVAKLDVGWTLAGVGIAVGLAASLILIRAISPNGLGLLIFLSFSVWAADIFAYLVGRSVGGPKLMPRVSPKKTWSGFLGGLAGAIIMGAGVASVFTLGDIVAYAGIAGCLALLAQIGDLAESAVKRRFNVKDASNLIPGHGGILDRVDGLTPAAFALFFIVR